MMLICAVTGWGQPEDLRKSAAAGFDHHLVKPLDPDTLMAVLHQFAASHRSRVG